VLPAGPRVFGFLAVDHVAPLTVDRLGCRALPSTPASASAVKTRGADGEPDRGAILPVLGAAITGDTPAARGSCTSGFHTRFLIAAAVSAGCRRAAFVDHPQSAGGRFTAVDGDSLRVHSTAGSTRRLLRTAPARRRRSGRPAPEYAPGRAAMMTEEWSMTTQPRQPAVA